MARALLQEDVPFEVLETDLDLTIPLDPDVIYTLRAIPVEQARAITKAHTKTVPNPRTHQMDPQTNWEAIQTALLDYCVQGWVGIIEGGIVAPCDLAHKLHLPIVIQAALIARAQVGEGAAQRAASFREPAAVL